MSYPNRKTVRAHLAAKITSDITDLQTVFDYRVKDPGGISPFCEVTNGPIQYDVSTDVDYQKFKLEVDFWVRSDGDASPTTRDAATDKLDDLAVSLAQVVGNYYGGSFYQQSDSFDAEMIDGTVYCVEIHYVEIRWRYGYNA
jgi:hypothetical protein